MAPPKLYNLCRVVTATTGTGTMTLGAAVSGFLTFAGAGVSDGETVGYAISEGSNSEIGTGVYTASGTTLTRAVLKSTNTDAAISLSGTAQVFITPSADDLVGIWTPDTDASHRLTIAAGSNLSADRVLTLTTGDEARALTLTADATISAALTHDVAGATLLRNVEDQTITGGARVTSKSIATGSFTVDPGDRPLQHITNNGAFTITAPANDGSILLLVTNGASAAAITFTGFQVGTSTGDALTTTDGHDFLIQIARINSIATYIIKALQ